MLLKSTLTMLALAAFAQAQDPAIDAALAEYGGIEGASELLSIYSKYATVSGFSAFQSAAANEAVEYAMTQTHVTAVPTETDPAALATDPVVLAIASDISGLVTEFMATETYLPSGAMESLVADLGDVIAELEAGSGGGNGANGTASPNGTAPMKPTATDVTRETGAAAGLAAGMGGLLVAGVAAVAMVL